MPRQRLGRLVRGEPDRLQLLGLLLDHRVHGRHPVAAPVHGGVGRHQQPLGRQRHSLRQPADEPDRRSHSERLPVPRRYQPVRVRRQHVDGAPDPGAALRRRQARRTGTRRRPPPHRDRRGVRALAIRPDGDAWLLASMLQVIFEEGLADEGGIADQTSGVEVVEEFVAGFPPEATESRTGIAPEIVRDLARSAAKAPGGRLSRPLRRVPRPPLDDLRLSPRRPGPGTAAVGGRPWRPEAPTTTT